MIEQKIRIDKWLWAARFFKTRSLAAKAVNGGKVHSNGQRVKAARIVVPGDIIRIHRSGYEYTVKVLALNDKRRPAKEAILLYEESEESIALRSDMRETRRAERLVVSNLTPLKRPGKRDRRLIRAFTRKN